MKKSVLLTVMALGLAAVNSASAQGHIEIGNYQGAYNQVLWSGGPRNGLGVLSTEGVALTVWFGEGAGLAENLLTAGPSLLWKADTENLGASFWGFYQFTEVVLPGWSAGETYTFQIRASGANGITGKSITWNESANINGITDPPTPASRSGQSIGFLVQVPEPSTFALAGLGSAAMFILRRRKS